MTTSLPPQALVALQAGRKIEAIKIVRESMGVSQEAGGGGGAE